MKYHNFHDFGTPTPLKEKSSDHKLKLLKKFDVNLTSFLEGVMDNVLNVKLEMNSD